MTMESHLEGYQDKKLKYQGRCYDSKNFISSVISWYPIGSLGSYSQLPKLFEYESKDDIKV